MIRVIKLGNLIYENIEPKTIDENGNEIWNVPNDLTTLQQAIADTLVWFEKQRLQETIEKRGYFGLSDIQFYVSQNDTEAQAILNWYQTYDDLIWNWIENTLPTFQTVEDLLNLDLKKVEEDLFNQSVEANPLLP